MRRMARPIGTRAESSEGRSKKSRSAVVRCLIKWRAELVAVASLVCLAPGGAVAGGCDDEVCAEGEIFEKADIELIEAEFGEGATRAPFAESIHTAIETGNIEFVRYIASRGWLACPARDEDCDYLGIAAFMGSSEEMLRFLLDQNVPLKSDAARLAARGGNLPAVRLFCERGADVNPTIDFQVFENSQYVSLSASLAGYLRDQLGRSSGSARSRWPLRDARISSGQAAIAAYLEHGACNAPPEIRARFDDYEAAIEALRLGNLAAVRALVSRDLVESDNEHVLTHLVYEAVVAGNIDILNYLETQGWLGRCRASDLCIPVHIAAYKSEGATVLEWLIARDFAPDEHGHERGGATPLHFAAIAGNARGVEFLCNSGADLRKANTLNTPEKSTISGLRRSYGSLWCALNEDRNEVSRSRCGDLGSFDVEECMPGRTCMSVEFPPSGPPDVVQQMIGLSDAFQILAGGQCESVPTDSCYPGMPPGLGVVIAEAVQPRSMPGADAPQLADTLPFGTVVDVLGAYSSCIVFEHRRGRWIEVRARFYGPAREVQGWVFDSVIDYLPGNRP